MDSEDLTFVQDGYEEDKQPKIKTASLDKVIERMTYEKYPCKYYNFSLIRIYIFFYYYFRSQASVHFPLDLPQIYRRAGYAWPPHKQIPHNPSALHPPNRTA